MSIKNEFRKYLEEQNRIHELGNDEKVYYSSVHNVMIRKIDELLK